MVQALARRDQRQQMRRLTAGEPGAGMDLHRGDRRLINFSSNDYLGLSRHPAVVAGAQRYLEYYGAGSPASRLVTGTYGIHQQLEERLAAACGQEAALLFNTGFQANATVLAALVNRQSLVLCDRQIHASLLQGIQASRAPFQRFRHNDLNHLEYLLQGCRSPQGSAAQADRVLIVTETLFSMDGDRADLPALVALADRYGALLYLDDAHGLGVLGAQGMGLASHQAGVDVVVGTFGKAFGSFGAVVLGSQVLRDYLINYCPGFIYTTALPPAVVGAIAAALDLMPHLEPQRQHLQHQGQRLRQALQGRGWDTGSSSSHIVPLVVGEEDRTLALAAHLQEAGLLAVAIRPPTVAPGTARLRLALSSAHEPSHYDRLLAALDTWQG
ncbi:8-amino-7-oxononanoate synthase [Prochlorothrix hollandica]|uniref:8-amino-7-ketopelargonate synthase n=1 Tax=Prochlorothrix hollandica PCC 9006 = CALU 1027 TaxID=317619 RepID=A0A0M2PTU9_PROHO|nr:8-amino-7-oxononanoate synthase [Prochlorothrix hollandica PCC 9006 = CALU 1027]